MNIFQNLQKPLPFQCNFPEWETTLSDLTNQDGRWISCLGPLDSKNIRHTGLDIYLVEKSGLPHQESLKSYLQFTYENETIGTILKLEHATRSVGGISAPEIKLHLHRVFAGQMGPMQIDLVKQWTVIPYQNYFVTIIFESVQLEYEKYVEVYETCIQSWKFL